VARILSGTPAERVVDRTLRDHRDLSREQRQALVEALFNVGLWRRRLGHLLGREDASPALLLYALLHGLAGVPAAEAAALAGVEAPPALDTRAPPSLALRHSLPDWLAEHYARELGPEAEDFCAHLNVPGPITLRVNSLRTDRETLADRLRAEGVSTRPGPWSPLALHVEGPRPNIYGLASYREGLFEVQDEGSQLLGLLVEARPEETVLDLCAGAGGKTLLLGAAMANSGRVFAYDPDAERLRRLERRCVQAGLTNVRVLWQPPEGLSFQRVLVDAPCSELGTLRRGPDLRFRLRSESLAELPHLQRELLERAARLVRPGGRIVYATCTLAHAENEGLVAGFLAQWPDFRAVPPGAGWLPPECVREGRLFCVPHRHGTDGFFAAVLERASGSSTSS
jgi:16S rRNA (cytosine967-C5)-methyltransferase